MNHILRTAMLGTYGVAGLLVASGAQAGCGATDSQCDVSGHACTWLGKAGETAFNGDGHERLDTSLYWTMDMTFGHDGTVWFIDWNDHLIRKVTTDGKVASVVGWSDPVFPGDGNQSDPTAEYSAVGTPGTEVQLNHPTDLHELADGSILIVAWHNHKLRKLDPQTGMVRVVSGGAAGFRGDGGPASAALFKQPSRFAFDEQENIYLIDQQNERVRRIDAQTQVVTTIAGDGTRGFAGDGGPALQARFNWAVGDNPEPAGGIAYRAGKLYIADTDNHRIRLLDLQTGMIDTIAGTGAKGFAGDDGPATAAMLYSPRDLELGPDGELYVADTDNGRVRALDLTTGVIRTVVGTDTMGLDPDEGRLATRTQLNRPFGIDFDAQGNLYVSDTINSRILKVTR